MEGKLSVKIFNLQRVSLACSLLLFALSAWSRQLILQILQMLHARWVFHNVSLCDNSTGYPRLQQRNEVMREVDHLSQLDPRDMPERSHYLLETNFASFKNESLVYQTYLLYAM